MAVFDFQSYVSCRLSGTGRRPVRVQNYACLEDIERQRQLSDLDIVHKAVGFGLQAWRLTEGRRLEKSAEALSFEGSERLTRAWAEVCARMDHELLPLKIIPHQKKYFESYGGTEGVFFAISGAACSLPTPSLRYLFGTGIGALDNGHVPYLTLMRFVDDFTGGLVSRAGQLPEALLHWLRWAQLTEDRAGLLACRDIGAAMFVIMKAELDWEDAEIMQEIRRYYAHKDADWGTPEIEKRLRALELFAASRLYLHTSGRPIEEIDDAVRQLYAIFK